MFLKLTLDLVMCSFSLLSLFRVKYVNFYTIAMKICVRFPNGILQGAVMGPAACVYLLNVIFVWFSIELLYVSLDTFSSSSRFSSTSYIIFILFFIFIILSIHSLFNRSACCCHSFYINLLNYFCRSSILLLLSK